MVAESMRDFGEGPRSICGTMRGKGTVDQGVVEAAMVVSIACTKGRGALGAVAGEVGEVEGGSKLVQAGEVIWCCTGVCVSVEIACE
jgi:hypothetical protein